jgi:RNA polymerase sigma-70 factor (ECF subfamily)
LLTIHEALLLIAPTLGARVAHAAAVGRVEGPVAGLRALDAIPEAAAHRFQPAWATREHLLADPGRTEEAVQAYQRAISLTSDTGARGYLERRRARLPGKGDESYC